VIMTTRIHRLWQPGNPQRRVFLPNFWMKLVRTPTVGEQRLPRNCAKFQVPLQMTRLDVRQYLEKIYDLPVRDVTTYVEQGDITWSNRADTQYRRAVWKKDDRKYAIVVMERSANFIFPDLFPADQDETNQIEQSKKTVADFSKPAELALRNRKGIGKWLA